MTKEDRDQLAHVTSVRRRLLRRGVVDARKQVVDAERTLRGVLEAGEPTNGLSDAIKEVGVQLSRCADALRRTEEAQFSGDLEPVVHEIEDEDKDEEAAA